MSDVVFRTAPPIVVLNNLFVLKFIILVLLGVLPYYHKVRRPAASFIRPPQSERLEYLKNGLTRITKFTWTSTLTCCTATLVMTSLARRAEVFAKKPAKMPPAKASGGISLEWFKRGSRNFTNSLGTILNQF